MSKTIRRIILLPDISKQSVFLWGPRKVGKSFWIRHYIPRAEYIDLLKTDTFAEYASRPALLRERYANFQNSRPGTPIVIDEVQKCPALLDEVHWLIENRGQTFLLTGSSARKLRRSHANLLAGRAWRREMRPLCSPELSEFDLEAAMHSGFLPPHFLSAQPSEDLRAYVADYLREEIAQEASVRNLPAFANLLRVAALTNSELLNYANVARESGVSPKVARGYFQLLEDTLLGFRIPPWAKTVNRRLVETEKFYLFDVGIANYLARRKSLLGSSEFGKSFEHFILMELIAFRSYKRPELEISFWRTANRQEVDFILDDKAVAIEVRASQSVHPTDIRWLSLLAEDGPVRKRVLVAFVSELQILKDRFGEVEVLPWRLFLDRLWAGDLVG